MATDTTADDEPSRQEQSRQRQDSGERKSLDQDGYIPGLFNSRLPSRHNKLYRTPPTPDILVQLKCEQSFVLDSIALASISDDFTKCNPKYGSALPSYNAQQDWHTKRYFRFHGVKDTLAKNMQSHPGTSIDGVRQDWFNTAGHSFRYLSSRNEKQSNGYSNETRMGHGCLWQHPNPRMAQYERRPREFQGYCGRFGYRRTTPSLRQLPSTFGTNTTSSLY